ncbi:MAG TPA: carboxypeptidase regulatory-like domain-containing protein [Acidobacteriota bacterium]|jgi:hypothetical protein
MKVSATRKLNLGLLSLALLLCLSGQTNAQQLNGTLTGTVMDASGAVIPGADITLKNEDSGNVRKTISNDEGYFTIAAVPPGSYTVSVEVQGFSKWEQNKLVLHAGDKLNLSDIKLNPAGAGEKITVVSTPEIITPVDSGEKSALLTSTQIDNIAIVGRSAAELLKVLPGMTPLTNGLQNRPGFNGEIIGINGNGDGGKQSAIGNYSANGGGSDALDIVSDGAHVSDPGCNCASPVNPNPDMIEEIKVLQSNFGAENSKGPVVFHSVTKAGGKDFHGEAYYYFRDYRLNSNEWLLNKLEQPRTKNKFKFPGGNIGGPVLIPGTNFNRNRDKLFFFTGFEYMKQRLDTGILQATVPTAAMRAGDFSDANYMKLLTQNGGNATAIPTAAGIVGGKIPANLIDKGGQVLMNLYPLPNVEPARANGYNFVQAIPIDQDMTQFVTRVDYSVSENTKLFIRYNRQAELQPFPVGLWWRNGNQVPYPTSVVADNRSHSLAGTLTHVFNPSLTNETIFSTTYINFPNRLEDPQKVSKSALGYPYKGIFKNGLDQIPSVIPGWGGVGTIFNPGGFDPVLFAKKWLNSASDNVSKVFSTHTTRFGVYYEWINNNQPGNGNSNGVVIPSTWGENSTGNVFSDLLMGRVTQYEEQTKNALHNTGYHIIEFYVQDSWKVTPRFTLELGSRFSHLGAWYDREGNGLAVVDLSRLDPKAPADALPGIFWHKKDNGIPLSGIKSRPLFVSPRLGFAYDLSGRGRTVLRGGFGTFRYHDNQVNFLDTPAGVRGTSFCCGTTLSALDALSAAGAVTSVNGLDPKDDKQPVTWNWSMTVQRRLPLAMMLEASYVGSKSDDILNSGDLSNVNAVPLGAMLNDPDGDQNKYRPFPNYGNVSRAGHTLYSNYNSFQALLSRQTGRIGYMASYTFGKTLGIRGSGVGGTVGGLDPRRFSYGVLGSDRTHVFNIAYNVLLPNFVSDRTSLAHTFLDGWQFSGITNLMSGMNLQTQNSNFAITGTDAEGRSIGNTRFTGSPQIAVMPVLTCDPRDGASGDRLFNASCFSIPKPGQLGTYVWPYLKGPKYQNHDLSLFKNFPIDESKKVQFRLSAYNFLNHPLRSLDNQNITLQFDGGKLANSNLGVLPKDNKFGRRIIQMAFKYYF